MPDNPATSPSRIDIDAWHASRVVPERRQFLTANALVWGLQPLWILFDYHLAPEHWTDFAWLRIADVLVGFLLIPLLSGAAGVRTIRGLGGARLILTAIILAHMMTLVDGPYYPYLFGSSLIFWGTGLVLTVPLRVSGLISGAMLLAFAGVLWQAGELPRPTFDYVGGAFFLASAAAVACSSSLMRLRSEREAFMSARELGRTNLALSDALAALKDAQLRMVESEKLMALGRLLAGLSHEINNPLTVIQNNVEPLVEYRRDMTRYIEEAHAFAQRSDTVAGRALLESYQALDIEYARDDSGKALQSIAEATERIRAIHADLRSFIRGKSLERGMVDLNEGIRATLRMLERGLPEGVTIRTHLDELPPVYANAGQLNQVVLNLARNGLDALGDAGVLDVSTIVRDGVVEVVVTDDGPGIPPELKDRIFEPFFTTKEVGKGTGLGLSISYEIIDQHGGDITVDRTARNGARFVVRLPTADGPVRPTPASLEVL